MVIGSLIFAIIRNWIEIVAMILFNPLLLIKISFVWFGIFFSVSYLFFVLVHKSDVLCVRREMAIHLLYSLLFGFVVASLLEAIYAFLLWNVSHSDFFAQGRNACAYQADTLITRMSMIMTLVAGLCASYRIGSMLHVGRYHHWSDRYGWVALFATMLCVAFVSLIVDIV